MAYTGEIHIGTDGRYYQCIQDTDQRPAEGLIYWSLMFRGSPYRLRADSAQFFLGQIIRDGDRYFLCLEDVVNVPTATDLAEARNSNGLLVFKEIGEEMEGVPFTDIDRNILHDLSRNIFPHPTDDWVTRQSYSSPRLLPT